MPYIIQTDLQMGPLVIFPLCTVAPEIPEIVDAETKIGSLILTDTKSKELTIQMAVTGRGTETLQKCKQCTNHS